MGFGTGAGVDAGAAGAAGGGVAGTAATGVATFLAVSVFLGMNLQLFEDGPGATPLLQPQEVRTTRILLPHLKT
jgi:hypothetical protein